MHTHILLYKSHSGDAKDKKQTFKATSRGNVTNEVVI